MWIVKAAQNFELSFHLLKDSVLANLLFIEDLDGDFVPCLFMEGHFYSAK